MRADSEEAQTTGSVSLTVAGTTFSMAMPLSALTQIGVPALGVSTVMSEEYINTFDAADPEAEMLAAPLSSRLVGLDAIDISVSGLEEPIHITMDATREPSSTCAYWDEVASAWIVGELDFLDESGTTFVCATPHLTIFGGVLSGFSASFQCTNAEVMTSEAMSKLGTGGWQSGLGAILLIMIIIAEILLMAVLTYITRKQMELREWSDEYLITDDDALVPESKGFLSALCGSCDFLNPDLLSKRLALSCARHTLAWEHNVVTGDLKTLLELPGLTEDDEDPESPKKERTLDKRSEADIFYVAFVQGTDHVAESVEAFFDYSFCKRVWILYLAFNAWFSLQHFSFSLPSSMRGLLVICRMQGALFVSALFFSNGAVARTAPAECDTDNVGEKIGMVLATAILSFLIGSVPFLLLVTASRRSLVHAYGWDEDERRRYLMKLRCKAWLCWFLALFYWGFCTFFLFCFLANVAKSAQSEWIVSAFCDLLLSILVTPFIAAVGLTVLTSWAKRREEDIVSDVLSAFGVYRERAAKFAADLRDAADAGEDQDAQKAGASQTPRSEGSDLGGVKVDAGGWAPGSPPKQAWREKE